MISKNNWQPAWASLRSISFPRWVLQIKSVQNDGSGTGAVRRHSFVLTEKSTSQAAAVLRVSPALADTEVLCESKKQSYSWTDVQDSVPLSYQVCSSYRYIVPSYGLINPAVQVHWDVAISTISNSRVGPDPSEDKALPSHGARGVSGALQQEFTGSQPD